MRVAVIIPVKSFTVAKGRLADTLTPAERHSLALLCANTVMSAARDFTTYVACSDPDVEQWAVQHGARVVHCAVPGLDNAVSAARHQAQHDGFTHVVVTHADLPLATTFQHIPLDGVVSLVTDRHKDGTNVLSFPIDSSFSTAYGPGSFDNHQQLAHQAGLSVVVIDDDNLALDLDTADDLNELEKRKRQHERQ